MNAAGFAARALAALLASVTGLRAGAAPDPSLALRERHEQLRLELLATPYDRPLHLDSSDDSGRVAGEVLAVMPTPFETTRRALATPGPWCELMLLHVNTKLCDATGEPPMLRLAIGTRVDQPLEKASRLAFTFHAETATPRYLRVVLHADTGPLVTHDYRIAFEAAPTEDGGTLMRMTYSYGFGVMARMAGEAYLGTVGRNKVGFTVVEGSPGAIPAYIGGMRGVVERNVMRYYLAIEAYLAAQSLPPESRREASLRAWFAAIEKFPRQLHEMDLPGYLALKHREYLRQDALAGATVR